MLLPVLKPVPARSVPSHGPNMQEVFWVVNVPLPKQHAVAVLLQGLKKREDVKLLIKKDV